MEQHSRGGARIEIASLNDECAEYAGEHVAMPGLPRPHTRVGTLGSGDAMRVRAPFNTVMAP